MEKIKPMLAHLEPKPWSRENWIWEEKFDGERAIVDTGAHTIMSRSGRDKTAHFPEIRPRTVKPAILDGEIVVFAGGKTCFNMIQHRNTTSDMQFRMAEYPAQYMVFDVLAVDGISVMSSSLAQRKKLLQAVLVPDERVKLTPFTSDGEALFANAVADELEGVIGKDLTRGYCQNSRDWVKVKRSQVDHFIVVGYTAGTGWRASTFGALVLAKPGDNHLFHVGEVGTGFNDLAIDELFTTLRLLGTGACPFGTNPYPASAQVTWVPGGMQVIVQFLEYTNDGKLRFPSFKGIVK